MGCGTPFYNRNGHGAQGRGGGGGGASGDPFSKHLKDFADVRVIKFSLDKGHMSAFKWIVHVERMVSLLDLVPT